MRHLLFSQAPPDYWPTDLSTPKLVSLTKRYLQDSEWTVLEPWDWLRVLIRARRENCYLNIMPLTDRIMRWTTVVNDLRERASTMDSTIGILTLEHVHQTDIDEALNGGSFIIRPPDLENVQIIAERASARRRELRETARRMED